jgi:hypothetical protein
VEAVGIESGPFEYRYHYCMLRPQLLSHKSNTQRVPLAKYLKDWCSGFAPYCCHCVTAEEGSRDSIMRIERRKTKEEPSPLSTCVLYCTSDSGPSSTCI